MPNYYTLKSQVPLPAGATLAFTAGKGYFAKPGPTLQQQADQMAGQQLTAAEAPIQSQAALAQQQADAHGQAIQGFSTALASVLKNIEPVVNGAYADASSRDAVFAKGFSDAMAAKTQGAADDTNSFLRNVVHAPDSQQLSSAPQAAAGDVAYGLGGYVPATDLSREGAGFSAAAAQLPGIAQLQGLQDYTSNVFAGRDQQKTFQDQIAQLAAQRPSIASNLYSQLADLQIKQQAQDLNQRIAQANLGIKAATVKETTRHHEQQETAAAKRANAPNAALSKLFGYAVNSAGEALLGKDGKPVPVAQAANAPKVNVALSKAYGYLVDSSGNLITKGGKPVPLPVNANKGKFTPAQIQKYTGLALTGAQVAYTGKGPSGNSLPPLTYQQALLEGRKEGIPVKIMKAALNQFYKPGERGRPQTYTTVKPVGSLGVTASVPNG